MRGLRSTIALFVVLAGLGSYIYFVAPKGEDEGTSSKNEKLFAPIEAAKISELKVKSGSGDVTALKKVDAVWQIVSPVTLQASQTDANALASAVADMEVVRVLEEAPTDLKKYGLDTPRIEVDFKSEDGKTAGQLLVGSLTPTEGNIYARRADQKRVVLIAQFNESPLNKSTFDLRDKTILKFDRSKVDGLDASAADGKSMAFTKSGTDWQMTRPFAARTDGASVEVLLGHVENAQMKSIVSPAPTPADLKKFGLDKPATTVSLHVGTAITSLMVGGPADEGTVYARDSSKPDVVTIDKTAADDLNRPVDDYRKREVFDFRAFNATRVEITRNGQAVVFERVKAKDDKSPDTWHRASPNPGDPDREKVESLLAGLADIRGTGFVDPKTRTKTGLDAPVMTVAATFDDGKKQERATFGRNGTSAYATRPDDPSVLEIEPQKLDEAIKALDELSK